MQTKVFTGQSVSRIAALELGDARQFQRIMQANGLSSPIINVTMTLNIPSPDPTAALGIPS